MTREMNCAWCENAFRPTHHKTKYCGEECRVLAERERRRRCAETVGRSACEDCGVDLGQGSKWRGAHRCITCHQLHLAERVDNRARKIVEWWAQGLTVKEIAARLDWSFERVSVEFHQLRKLGYDLPYRRRLKDPRFPKQVAA
jgi:hypothetical protein